MNLTDEICTYAFLHFQTVELPNNQVQIKEISVTTMPSYNFKEGKSRVQCKLLPQQNFMGNQKITDSDNDVLEKQGILDGKMFKLLNCFLKCHNKPLYLVINNGNEFGYPQLKDNLIELEKNSFKDIWCIDLLKMFQNLCQRNKLKKTSTMIIAEEMSAKDDEILVAALEKYEGQKEISREYIQKSNLTTPVKSKSRQPCEPIVVKRKQHPTEESDTNERGKRARRCLWKSKSECEFSNLENIYTFLLKHSPDNENLIELAMCYREEFLKYTKENAIQLTKYKIVCN